jgi:hypothetical protein
LTFTVGIDFFLDLTLTQLNDSPINAAKIGGSFIVEKFTVIVSNNILTRSPEKLTNLPIHILIAVIDALDVDEGLNAFENNG